MAPAVRPGVRESAFMVAQWFELDLRSVLAMPFREIQNLMTMWLEQTSAEDHGGITNRMPPPDPRQATEEGET